MIILKPTTILLQYLLYITSLVLKVSVQPLSVYSQLALDANMVPLFFQQYTLAMMVITAIGAYLNALSAQDNHQIEQQSKLILVLLSYIVGLAEAKLHWFGATGYLAPQEIWHPHAIFPRKNGTPPGDVEPLPSQEMLHPGHKIS